MIIEYTQVNVNRVNKKGRSALFIACKQGNKEMVELLVAAHAKLNIPKNEESYALHLAANSGCCELMKILLTNDVCVYK